MKKIIISLSLVIASLFTLSGQSIDEAFRYSQLFYGGTARFQSMGGAFTSLGGDLSVLTMNPAGLAMFRSTDISITPQMYFNNSKTDFGNTSTSDNTYDLNLNQIGIAVPIIEGNGSSGLVSLNFGYSYNMTNNFNGNAVIKGELDNSSMVDYFMNKSQGYDVADLYDDEFIVFEVWMFDTIPGTTDQYGSVFSDYGNNANSSYGQNVRRIISSEGSSSEHSLSLAANFSDKIYLGFTLGISSVFSVFEYDHYESDPNNLIPSFSSFTYRDYVETEGKGFSVKLGAIIRPVEFLRIGFAVHSPIVYRMNEFYFDAAEGFKDDGFHKSLQNEAYRFSYTITTPLRFTTGAALQLGKKGIISADYEFVDYKMARYSNASDDYNYYQENQDIKNVYDVAHNLRLGAELRLSSSLYLRGGYSLYGSGFNSDEYNADNSYSVYSGGLGIRQSNFYFDLAYSIRSNEGAYFMYQHDNLDPANIKYNRNMISATIGFRL